MNEWFLIFACVVVLVIGAICWRLVSGLVAVSGSSQRARDRERQDLHRLMEHLLEKKEVDPRKSIDLSNLHRVERTDVAKMSTQIEMNAAKVQRTGTPDKHKNSLFNNDPQAVETQSTYR